MAWSRAVKTIVAPGRHGHRREKRGAQKRARRMWRRELDITEPIAVSIAWDGGERRIAVGRGTC